MNSIKKFIFGLIVVVIIFTVCFFAFFHSSRQAAKIIPPINNATSTIPEVKNLTYIIEGQSIALANGVSEISIATDTAEKETTQYFGKEINGDLTGEGRTDAAFLLTQDSGGSGKFYYLAVALATDNGYQGTNALFLGDRIAPQSTEINKGIIVVNYLDRKPEDSFTVEPSVAISRYFRIAQGSLIEVGSTTVSSR
jgi:hypothetical protein